MPFLFKLFRNRPSVGIVFWDLAQWSEAGTEWRTKLRIRQAFQKPELEEHEAMKGMKAPDSIEVPAWRT